MKTSMRHLLLLALCVVAHAATYTSSQAGNWASASTWGGSGTPGAGDNAIIGHAVTIADGTTVTVGTRAPATPCVYTTTGCQRPTMALTGTGTTSLSTASHFIYYTVVDANGESGFSAESAGLAVTNGGTPPKVTFPSAPLPGQTYNLYSGTAIGAEKLYATGISASTYDMLIAEPAVTTHPGLGNTAIRLNTPGSLTIGTSTGATLILQGDVALNNATLTINGGSTLKFDTTASNITTAPYVAWVGTAGSQASAKIATANTSSINWAFITYQTGGVGGRFDPATGSTALGGRYTDAGPLAISYVQIDHCGGVDFPCFGSTASSFARDISISHVTCDFCGRLIHNWYTIPSAENISLANVDMHNSVSTTIISTDGPYSIYLSVSAGSTAPTGTRSITDSDFDLKAWLPQNQLTASGNYFQNAFTFSSGLSDAKKWAAFTGNLVRKTSVQTFGTGGDESGNYWMVDEQTLGNPHFIAIESNGTISSWTVSGDVFEYTGPKYNSTTNNDVGDAMLVPNMALTIVADHNLVLPNTPQTDASGVLMTLFQADASLVSVTLHHNTFTMGALHGGTSINETNSGTNMSLGKVAFRDNLGWNPSTLGYTGPYRKIVDIKDESNVAAAPGDFLSSGDYNSGCALTASSASATSTTAGGYWVKSSVQLGAHDVDFTNCTGASSPGFIDPARNFSKWGGSLGSTGTDAQKRTDALNKLLYRNDRLGGYSGYTVSNLISYVKAGFVPTSARVKNADSTGTGTIGAIAWQAAPIVPPSAVLLPIVW